MKEDLIYFIWEYQVFRTNKISTTSGDKIEVLDVGVRNNLSGPDYKNCKIKIGDKVWLGDVEIHLKSSDWNSHNHNRDNNYNNVILHVVYKNNSSDIKTNNDKFLFTLELEDITINKICNNYENLIDKNNKSKVYCSDSIGDLDNKKIKKWFSKLYIQRLNHNMEHINKHLIDSNNNWEFVLLKMIANGFGLKLNKDVFLELFSKIPYSVIRKEQNSLENLEALFFGTLGLLKSKKDKYPNDLKEIYDYLCIKYSLKEIKLSNKLNFFKCYPNNYPTIRLSQIANLINKNNNLFFKVVNLDLDKKKYYDLLEDISTSNYWETHFVFDGKLCKKRTKRLSKDFIDILIINVFLPISILYKQKYEDDIINYRAIYSLLESMKPEKNSIVNRYHSLGFPFDNALDTQAILELRKHYCNRKKCIYCDIGKSLILNK